MIGNRRFRRESEGSGNIGFGDIFLGMHDCGVIPGVGPAAQHISLRASRAVFSSFSSSIFPPDFCLSSSGNLRYRHSPRIVPSHGTRIADVFLFTAPSNLPEAVPSFPGAP